LGLIPLYLATGSEVAYHVTLLVRRMVGARHLTSAPGA